MGLGYVGCVTSACLASLGNYVFGVDCDDFKVDMIRSGRLPFFEPGLEDLIRENVQTSRLRAGVLTSEELASTDVVFICVGTPSRADGDVDLSQIRRVCEQVVHCLEPRTRDLVIAVRSTVPPGTCESLKQSFFSGHESVYVASNPEFLREGSAVEDFFDPPFLVVGATTPKAASLITRIYSKLPTSNALVSVRTAEMVKYVCNAFHAVKIGFANEIGTLAAEWGVNPLQVMEIACRDVKLNISSAYLKPGASFGGSCLPKDLRALDFRASHLNLKLPLLGSVLTANEEHLQRSIREILALDAGRIGIFGLAFKEGTDDLRQSPVISVVEHLLRHGRYTRIFDPRISIDGIYGSNLRFALSALPQIDRLIVPSAKILVDCVDVIVITQRPTPDLAALFSKSGKPMFDFSEIPNKTLLDS